MPELLAALVRQATKTATVRQIGSVSNITVFPMEQKKAPHDKKGIMKESFLIPIDLHKDLFADEDALNKERADNLVAKIDVVS